MTKYQADLCGSEITKMTVEGLFDLAQRHIRQLVILHKHVKKTEAVGLDQMYQMAQYC